MVVEGGVRCCRGSDMVEGREDRIANFRAQRITFGLASQGHFLGVQFVLSRLTKHFLYIRMAADQRSL